MKKNVLYTSYEIVQDSSELIQQEQELLHQALKACENAYSPYSGFSVGAALMMEDGEIILGNNQENAAYPSGLCAERVAIYWTGANRKGKKIKAIAIRATSEKVDTARPIPPCGACRQAMLEYELNQGTDITMLMQGRSGDIIRLEGVKQLLPLYFNEEGLKTSA